MRYKREEKEVRDAVQSSRSKRQALLALGIRGEGGNYRLIDRWIKEYNINTDHWTGRGWSAGKSLPGMPLKEILVDSRKAHTNSHNLKKRLIKEKVFDHVCAACRLTEWRGSPIPLELDHINGVHVDNRIENLRLLCPNCHALTPTYRGKNKKTRARSTTADAGGLRPLSKDENLDVGSNPTGPTCKCGVIITKNAKTCKVCYVRKTKIDWPDKETVKEMVIVSGFSKTGRELGVSDNAIRKYLARA